MVCMLMRRKRRTAKLPQIVRGDRNVSRYKLEYYPGSKAVLKGNTGSQEETLMAYKVFSSTVKRSNKKCIRKVY